MQMQRKNLCPFAGFAECRQLDCALFTQLRGTHPQTGADIDEWGCSLAWLPVLLIENAQQVRQGAAATESLRNEMVRTTEETAARLGTIVALASRTKAQIEQDDIAASVKAGAFKNSIGGPHA
ncbi:hypothetical protein [Nitratidesulfovibrio vulgaris]|uniref:Uncharacterized protein n=1 Tax=Nitratidesulfovibrio vulgaris (strain ATCC 29579 / DSM 644 / CCUG 34227 / NCIMB 8303 / VKM B-1760 / Hildenborough) TaxID=882 RepID=Q72BE0_NITV2|nr:hypothetical protein [Nitratidesulfovibrio vulgaris]AAS96173.1 hypothetical protein DVU_1696 [Nitratidesulfovibrio vulgaris str. Hildenborough]ADP86751.1 hypothetical protein Deval_1598 [Nitratidesulfovibrio vulgaris RCH1]